MENKKIMSVVGIGGILIGGVAMNFIGNNGLSEDEIQSKIDTAVSESNASYIATLDEKDTEITSLKDSLNASLEVIGGDLVDGEIVITSGSFIGFLMDNLNIGNVPSESISDREFSKLLDSEIEFDGEDYDVEEVVELSGMEILVNEEDFESEPYLMIYENGVKYTLVFDDELNTSEISEDETLNFRFLGEEVEVSEWDGNEITFTKGNEFSIDEGEENKKIIGENTFVVKGIYNNHIKLSVDGIEKSISEGETVKFGVLEVFVKEFEAKNYAGDSSYVIIKVGEDIKNVVESGDEYSEDSIWEYVITEDSIGIVLKEDFKELDEDYKPLASGEVLYSPNNYFGVRYDGFEKEDFEELSFELETEDSINYVEISGDFQSGLEDYDKILVNSSGIYEDDKDKTLIHESEVNIGSSDVKLVLSGSDIVIEDFTLSMDLNESSEDLEDYDIRTDFGIKVNSPEDAVDDLEWSISVPHEKLESTISLI